MKRLHLFGFLIGLLPRLAEASPTIYDLSRELQSMPIREESIILIQKCLSHPHPIFFDARKDGEPISLHEQAVLSFEKLPSSIKKSYLDFFEPAARRALNEAAESGNLNALVDVAYQYRFTQAGLETFLLLGRVYLAQKKPSIALSFLELCKKDASTLNQEIFEPELSVLYALALKLSGSSDAVISTVIERIRGLQIELHGSTKKISPDLFLELENENIQPTDHLRLEVFDGLLGAPETRSYFERWYALLNHADQENIFYPELLALRDRVSALLKLLDGKSPADQYNALTELGSLTPVPPALLIRKLRETSFSMVKILAIKMLGASDRNSELIVPALVEALDYPVEVVRVEAVSSLANYGPRGLVPALTHTRRDVRIGVTVKLLGSKWITEPEILPFLLRNLDDSNAEVQNITFMAVASLAPSKPTETIPYLLTKLKSTIFNTRITVLNTFMTMDEKQADLLIPAMDPLLTDSDHTIRLKAAQVLGQMGSKAYPYLMEALESVFPEVRHVAAIHLAKYDEAGPALLHHFSDAYPLVRNASITALSELGDFLKKTNREELLAALFLRMGDPVSYVRISAIKLVAQIADFNHQESISKLKEVLLRDKDLVVRAEAAFALGACGPSADPEIADLIIELLKNLYSHFPEHPSSPLAVQTLTKLGTAAKAASPLLRDQFNRCVSQKEQIPIIQALGSVGSEKELEFLALRKSHYKDPSMQAHFEKAMSEIQARLDAQPSSR